MILFADFQSECCNWIYLFLFIIFPVLWPHRMRYYIIALTTDMISTHIVFAVICWVQRVSRACFIITIRVHNYAAIAIGKRNAFNKVTPKMSCATVWLQFKRINVSIALELYEISMDAVKPLSVCSQSQPFSCVSQLRIYGCWLVLVYTNLNTFNKWPPTSHSTMTANHSPAQFPLLFSLWLLFSL